MFRGLYLICLLGSSLYFSCSGSKQQAKKAAQLEASGMKEEAASYYWEALRRNPKNLEAQIGLKKTGQVVLDKMVEDYLLQSQDVDAQKAFLISKKALKYRSDASKYRVSLGISPQVEAEFNKTKSLYLSQLYTKGKSEIESDKFSEAERTFLELLSIDKSFQDSQLLYDVARFEPSYRKAKAQMSEGKYRAAYYSFDEILKQTDYKDSQQFREQARKQGTTTIAIFPYQNATRYPDTELRLHAHTLNELLAVKNPFLQVVDRQDFDILMQEQKLGVSGIVDDKSAAQTGKLLGIKVVVVGTLLDYNENLTPLQTVQKQGYEAFWVERYDTTTKQNKKVQQFKPVKYNESSQSIEVSASFQYKLIATETGRVLSTQIINRKLSDHVQFATYNGETENLFAGNQTAASTSVQSKRNLDNLLKARRNLKTNSVLCQEVFTSIAKEMAKQVTEIFEQD